MKRLAPLGWIAAVLLSIAPVAASGSDAALGSNTIFFASSDDWGVARTAMQNSDFGKFLNDPEIKAIKENLKTGFLKLINKGIQEEFGGGAEASEVNQALDLMKGWLGDLYSKTTGRMSLSLGYSLSESGMIMPEILLHFQGGEEFDNYHEQVIQLISSKAGETAPRTAFDLAGVSFKGIAAPPAPPSGPVQAPDGLFFGRKGNHYYVGLYKKQLEAYIKASGGEGTAVGARLGSTPFYQKCSQRLGSGQVKTFMSMAPIWNLVDRFMPPSAPGGSGPSPKMVIDALGLRSFQGFYGVGNQSAEGGLSKLYVGIQGRDGVFGLLPTTNSNVTMPKWVPANVVTVSAMRLELSRMLDIVMSVASAIGGEGMKQQISAGMAPAEAFTGMKLADLFGNMEGTVLFYQPESKAPPSFGMQMNMSSDMVLAMRAKDPSVFKKLLETLSTNPNLAAMFKSQEFLGRKVFTMNMMGDTPPEFAPAPGMIPTPTMTVDGDWFMVGMTEANLQEALRTADGEDAGRLINNSDYTKALAKVQGAGGIAISYEDTGRSIGGTLDQIRPILGFLPMMVPQIGQEEELLFLFNASNLPSSAKIQKYFGKVVSCSKIVDGGLYAEYWAPSVTAGK